MCSGYHNINLTFVVLYCKNLVDRCFQGNLSVYFLIYSYAAFKSNAFMVSLGTRWGFRCLKPVLRPYFTH